MTRLRCEAKGTHKHFNWLRNVWCTLPIGHEGRHIAYWNNVITDVWEEQTSGEIGGPGGGEYFNWESVDEARLDADREAAMEGGE